MKKVGDLKKVVETHKAINDKAVITVEANCNKNVKDAIIDHDKSVKEAFEENLENFRKKNIKNVNINEKEGDINNTKKPKLSKAKIKDFKENKIIEAFEKDCKLFGELRVNCGLDITHKTCRKCDFESHSEYLLRMHKEKDHNIKQTFQNLVLGYEYDVNSHIEVLKPMEEPIDIINCRKCNYKCCSEGKL